MAYSGSYVGDRQLLCDGAVEPKGMVAKDNLPSFNVLFAREGMDACSCATAQSITSETNSWTALRVMFDDEAVEGGDESQ